MSDFRSVYAQVVTTLAGVDDPDLRQAFAEVPRHDFIGRGPWKLSPTGPSTPSDDPALLYQDIVVALDDAATIPNGLPSLHARCISACCPRPKESIVHVGAGTGYYTAILGVLVGPTGRVTGYEIDEGLVARGRAHLEEWPWVSLESRSGVDAVHELVDVIYVSAGVQQIPLNWLSSLRVGGRLLLPLTSAVQGAMLLLVRTSNDDLFDARYVGPARFVPCVGAQDGKIAQTLAVAFEQGGIERITALRTDRAGSSAWCQGDGWWIELRPDRPDSM